MFRSCLTRNSRHSRSVLRGLISVSSAKNTKAFRVTSPRSYSSGHPSRLPGTNQAFRYATAAAAGASCLYLIQSLVGLKNVHTEAAPTVEAAYNSTRCLQSSPPPSYDLSEENLSGAKKELIALLGVDGVNDDLGTRISHSSTEWSAAPRGDLDRPSLIVYPRTTEDVSSIARLCHRRRIPMIGFSGGTSLEGTLAATHNEVCIDFKNMNKVIALHKHDMDVVVGPGVGYEELNQKLAKDGLFFPPDPGPGAQIGGMVSQSCSGTNAYRYGTMKDWVLGLTVVLADGTVIKTRHRPRKSNAGYDLTRLFVGSEGTLGFVTEASLKLTNAPENVKVAVAAFPTTHKAVETAVKIVENGRPLAAMELLDDVTMRAVNQGGYCEKEWAEVATLFLKFSGTKLQVEEQIKEAQLFAKESDCVSFDFSATDEEADALWQARKTALWSMIALKEDPDDKFLSADAAVPISRLADIIEATKNKIEASGLVGSCLGHVGDGNFHTTVLYGAKDKQKAKEIISATQKMGVDMGGTVTGEHGIGLEFREMVNYELGDNAVDTMRQIKFALDPLGLLNPDKLIRLKPEENPDVSAEGSKIAGDSSRSTVTR